MNAIHGTANPFDLMLKRMAAFAAAAFAIVILSCTASSLGVRWSVIAKLQSWCLAESACPVAPSFFLDSPFTVYSDKAAEARLILKPISNPSISQLFQAAPIEMVVLAKTSKDGKRTEKALKARKG